MSQNWWIVGLEEFLSFLHLNIDCCSDKPDEANHCEDNQGDDNSWRSVGLWHWVWFWVWFWVWLRVRVWVIGVDHDVASIHRNQIFRRAVNSQKRWIRVAKCLLYGLICCIVHVKSIVITPWDNQKLGSRASCHHPCAVFCVYNNVKNTEDLFLRSLINIMEASDQVNSVVGGQ